MWLVEVVLDFASSRSRWPVLICWNDRHGYRAQCLATKRILVRERKMFAVPLVAVSLVAEHSLSPGYALDVVEAPVVPLANVPSEVRWPAAYLG